MGIDTVRIGIVKAIDYYHGKVTIKYVDDNTSGSVTMLSNEYNMPVVGEFVIVLHPTNEQGFGVCLGRFYHNQNDPITTGFNVYRKNYSLDYESYMRCVDNCIQTISSKIQYINAKDALIEADSITLKADSDNYISINTSESSAKTIIKFSLTNPKEELITIPKSTIITSMTGKIFTTDNETFIPPYEQSTYASATCSIPGSYGNNADVGEITICSLPYSITATNVLRSFGGANSNSINLKSTSIVLETKTSTLEINNSGTITLKGKINIQGEVDVEGLLSATGEIKTNLVSLNKFKAEYDTHVHTAAQVPTSPPIQIVPPVV